MIINEDHIWELGAESRIVDYYSTLWALVGWEIGTLDAEGPLGEGLLGCEIDRSPTVDGVGDVVLEDLLLGALSTFMTSCNETSIGHTWDHILLNSKIIAVTLDAPHYSSRLHHWRGRLIDKVILNHRYLIPNYVDIGRCGYVHPVLSEVPYRVIDKVDVLWVINLHRDSEAVVDRHVGDVWLEACVVLESESGLQGGAELRAILNLYMVHVSLASHFVWANLHAAG